MGIELQSFYATEPPVDSRFVAFYCDGSGAALFKRDMAGDYHDADGDSLPDGEWFVGAGYYLYACLPDFFRLFFEEKL